MTFDLIPNSSYALTIKFLASTWVSGEKFTENPWLNLVLNEMFYLVMDFAADPISKGSLHPKFQNSKLIFKPPPFCSG